ncbi:MAG: putative toxin-antitoxin system toxin component, PIN family [Saprospiraceae bacterium]
MRVVLDTNILISACWKPGGNESRVAALTNLTVCISDQIEAEYREVAQRKKFIKHRDSLEALITAIIQKAERVHPSQTCTACSDPDDNQLLDCALAAAVDYVVTGNLKHFPPEWNGIQVINARRLLELI